MHKRFLIIGAVSAMIAVVLGAFGAHALKRMLGAESVSTFETGVRYQFYHTFALLIVAIIYDRFPSSPIRWAGYCFITGIILFSGSLYFLTYLKSTQTVGLSNFGLITPVGGLFFIAGWICLIIALLRQKQYDRR